jgi:adenine-specific DNA-methyltransferase
MNLTERDKPTIEEHLDRGEPLPPKYKLMFADAPEVELIWQGRSIEVTTVVVPFQSVDALGNGTTEVVEVKV